MDQPETAQALKPNGATIVVLASPVEREVGRVYTRQSVKNEPSGYVKASLRVISESNIVEWLTQPRPEEGKTVDTNCRWFYLVEILD